MTTLKLSDVNRAATLLKKLVEKADTNRDGAVRNAEVESIALNPRAETRPQQLDLKSAIHGAQRYSLAKKGSVTVASIKTSVDEIAASVKAADRDGDGKLNEAEYKALATLAEKRFVDFAATHAGDAVTDFTLAPQRTPKPPHFSWTGTPAQVCSSLLNAYSNPNNDNFWPGTSGASRYVVTAAEAQKMVTALEPLYASRQKSVITELAGRTASSTFGCVSVDAGARAIFQAYATRVGARGLTFDSPAAPRMPAP